MKKKLGYAFLLFGLVIILLSCGSDKVEETLNAEIDKLKQEYAPDRRTDRFSISATAKNGKYVLSGTTTSIKARDELIQYIEKEAIPFVDQITTYPDSTVGNQTWGLVNLSVCNIRSEPKHSAELATQEVLGTTLRVLSRKGDWYLVQTPNRYLGWLDAGGFIRLGTSQIEHWNNQPKRTSYVPTSWVYAEPNADAAIVSDIVAGALVIDREKRVGPFRKIELPDGRNGYMLDITTLQVDSAGGEQIVATAKRFLGVPYLWGGTSAKGFDCSGFSKSLYNYHGFLLPRDASQQVKAGKLINTDKTWKNLIPGDLLFFGSYREDGSERITHVAIYMGDGKIIHASGRVKIESLNPGDVDFANDRYDTFIKAKRMVENGKALNGVNPI